MYVQMTIFIFANPPSCAILKLRAQFVRNYAHLFDLHPNHQIRLNHNAKSNIKQKWSWAAFNMD